MGLRGLDLSGSGYGSSCERGNEPPGYIKFGREELLASHEGLCCMEFVCLLVGWLNCYGMDFNSP